jgi:hypothetical protein
VQVSGLGQCHHPSPASSNRNWRPITPSLWCGLENRLNRLRSRSIRVLRRRRCPRPERSRG